MIARHVGRQVYPQRVKFTLQSLFNAVVRGRRVRQDLAKLAQLLVFQLNASCETTNLRFGPSQTDL
ncbi:hypothetical protein WL00_27605 [Burkholderia cepacia]|nr:hypothetical protein WL00_27605 [Burkholderia cepacia]KVX72181.1 hypothetical protein WL07_13655 [Burkholderia cepacia]